jgi:two-component system, OmpR family, sensor histidine kinase KdpD
MLVMALVIASLVANVRAQTRVAGARERRTSLLYAMSRELAATRSFNNLARVAIKHVAETFASGATVLLPDADGHLQTLQGVELAESFDSADLSIAQWVFDHGRPAGLGTDTLPAAPAQYVPLTGTHRTLGVLAVQPSQRRGLCCRNRATCSRHSPAKLRSQSSARSAPTRPRPRASPWKPRVCATRCSRRSRTTCARR